jgi:hypothetical protein
MPTRIVPMTQPEERPFWQSEASLSARKRVSETQAWQVQEESSYKTSPLSGIATCPSVRYPPDWGMRAAILSTHLGCIKPLVHDRGTGSREDAKAKEFVCCCVIQLRKSLAASDGISCSRKRAKISLPSGNAISPRKSTASTG